jgi:peptidoglycan-N-acetylglucosamine deacetylase
VPVHAIAVVLLAIVGLGLLTFAPGVVLRVWGVFRLRRASRGRLVLTYDDGPGFPHPTLELLELLAHHDARATFFVVGWRAAANPSVCERVSAAGHEIGAHGYHHRHGWLDPLRAVTDLGAGMRTVARFRHERPIYRQPFGKSTLWTLLAGARFGAVPVWWTIDSCDSRDEPPEIEVILRRVDQEGGGVVLLHDYPRDPSARGVRFTLELTARLLELAATRGWPVCTVSEMRRGAPARVSSEPTGAAGRR